MYVGGDQQYRLREVRVQMCRVGGAWQGASVGLVVVGIYMYVHMSGGECVDSAGGKCEAY